MKPNRGMGTLMVIFSGVAALMCLLAGLQLLFLESQIGQAVTPGLADPDLLFPRWKAQVHMGAVMSLGAGVLIFLFGLRQLTLAGQSDRNQRPNEDSALSSPDLDDISVRVFEVDATDRSIEITPGQDDAEREEFQPPSPGLQPANQSGTVSDSDPEPVADPTETIVQSIHAATDSDPGHGVRSLSGGPFWSRWFDRLFRRR